MFDPVRFVEQLPIKEGDVVADLGSGSGHLVVPIANMVGVHGRVYAVDILEKKLEAVRGTAKFHSLMNVLTYRADLEADGVLQEFIKSGSADVAILANVLFANGKKEDIISHAAMILKKQGVLAVVEWKESNLPMAPSKELLVDPNSVVALCEKQGLAHTRDLEVGDCHFGKLFTKK